MLLQTPCLFCLLGTVRRLAVHPEGAEAQEASHRGGDARDPRPGARDDEAARPLVVGHVSHTDGALLLDVGQEWSLVVDHEVEDAVLVRQHKTGSEHGGRLGDERGGKLQAVERREHGKLKLQSVLVGDGKGLPLVPAPLRDGNAVGLR